MNELEEIIFSRIERDCELLKAIQGLNEPDEELKLGILEAYQQEKERLQDIEEALFELGWIDAGTR